MADDNKTVILRVTLDEGKTEDRMKELVLIMEQTRKAQAALTAERKAGTVSDDDFAKRSITLKNELRAQGQESTALQKNLELYRRAVNGVAGSYDQAQAQLSLAQRQYQQLADSAANGTESTQALTGVIDGLRNTLKATDAQQSLFVRNVGNYPKGENLEALIQQLVKLEEQSKNVTAGTKEAVEIEERRIGFQQAAVQAAAKEGKTYQETTSFIKGYSDALRPAVADLVRLEEEQAKVGDTGTEAYRKIGFQIAATQKQIAEVPTETNKVGDALEQIDQKTGAFGGQVGMLRQRFTEAKEGIELAKTGFTGLKGAIAATGIGVLLLALGALYEYFTKTDEGAEDLAAGLAFLKGVFSVLESVVIGAGKALVGVFKDPKQAGKDLLDFIGSQLINRVKAFGVIWDAIRNGDAKGLTNGILQYTTGVEHAIEKTKAFADEAARAGGVAYDLARAGNELEDAQRESLVTLEKNKNVIDKLVLSAKDRTLSEKERLANLDAAGKLETENLNTTIKLATEKLRIAKLTNDEAERTGKTSDDLRDAVAQAATDVERLKGQSASLQQAIQNRRSVLLQQEAADAKTAADKATAAAAKEAERRLQVRRDALTLQGVLLDRELVQVQAGSDQELSILQRKLNVAHDLELNVKNITLGQKRIADEKYESASLALTLDFNRRRVQAALQATADQTAAQLSAEQQGSENSLRLQEQQIENQRRIALAGLKETDDNTARIAAINAQAEQQRREAEFQEATRLLNNYLDNKRELLERENATGLLSENEYQRRLNAITKAGTDAQAVINSDYRQSNAENQKKASATEIAETKRVTTEIKRQEEIKQDVKEATMQASLAATDFIIQALGEETAAGQAALVLKKTLAVAEIAMNLEKQFAANAVAGAKISAEAPPFTVPLGIAYTIATDVLAAAAAGTAIANVLKLRQGGIAYGPSHEDGGIPLVRRGRSTGIEIEGGEPVLTANVSRMPHLLAAASAINVAAGGRPLVPSAFLAYGGIATLPVRDNLTVNVEPFNYEKMGEATAKALRKAPPVTRISDVKEALKRDDFTEKLQNT